MFLRKLWSASRLGVSSLGTPRKALTRERSSSRWGELGKGGAVTGPCKHCQVGGEGGFRRFDKVNFCDVLLSRYLPGKMMTDVALNIHFKVRNKTLELKYPKKFSHPPFRQSVV